MHAQSDAWQEYRSIYSGYNVATQVLRDFVYLKPNSLVIWDWLKMNTPVPNTVIIQGPGTTFTSAFPNITISGGIASTAAPSGAQFMNVTPLAPTSPEYDWGLTERAHLCVMGRARCIR